MTQHEIECTNSEYETQKQLVWQSLFKFERMKIKLAVLLPKMTKKTYTTSTNI